MDPLSNAANVMKQGLAGAEQDFGNEKFAFVKPDRQDFVHLGDTEAADILIRKGAPLKRTHKASRLNTETGEMEEFEIVTER